MQTETDNAGLRLCGDRVYEIVDASDVGISWMPITGTGPYTITASPTDEALVTGSSLDYYLKITFADARYPTPVKRMSVPVTVTAATCDCDLLTWDTPSAVVDAVEVALGPLVVTMPTATQNEASKLPTPAIRKCFESGGTCDFTSTWTPVETGQASLPSFITQTGTTDELTVTPTVAADRGSWTIYVTQTISYTSHGTTTTVEFDAVELTIGCTITAIADPSPPTSGLTYTLYEPTHTIDVSTIPFTQTPPCEYAVTESIVWTIDEPTVISASGDGLALYVWTMDPAKLGTHPVTITNTITYDGGTWAPTYSFDITIVDPCEGTELVTQSIEALVTDNGVVGVREFTEVQDTIEVAKGNSDLCGARAYSITYQDDTAITWVTVAEKAGEAGVWEITADPTLDEHETTHNLKLTVVLTSYTATTAALEINFNVVVSTPACECALVGWDAPAA